MGLQVLTSGPWVWQIALNGAAQPGGKTDTALLPFFDLLNHDSRYEVSWNLLHPSSQALDVNMNRSSVLFLPCWVPVAPAQQTRRCLQLQRLPCLQHHQL